MYYEVLHDIYVFHHEIDIFGEQLRDVCKHFIGYKKSESGNKGYYYCKAFPTGEGIPENYPCNSIFENFVIRGQIEPPMKCGKGYRFEFCPIHLNIKKYQEPDLFKDKE